MPGAVRSWGDAHRRWGRLSWEAVLAPAIEQAEGGFPAWDGLIAAVEGLVAEVGERVVGPRPRADVARAAGGRGGPASGSACRRSPATLRTLADQGFDAFYDGELGERIVRGLNAAGAPFTLADLREHRSTWAARSRPTYRGVRVTTHPPNSSGLIALEILNVLERFAPPAGARFGGHGWTDPAWIHLQLEAAKLAFADRDAHLTDPEAHDIPVDELRSKEHAAGLAARIDAHRADPSPPPARTLVGGTIYLAVVDGDGQRGEPHPVERGGLRLGRPRRGDRRPLPGPRRVVLARSRARERHRPGQADRAHAPARDAVPRGRPAAVGRRRARWAATSSRRSTSSSCPRSSTAAPTSGPRSRRRASSWSRPGGSRRRSRSSRTGRSPRASRWACGRSGTTSARTGFDGGLGHEHAIELVDGGPAADGTLAAIADPRSMGLAAVR